MKRPHITKLTKKAILNCIKLTNWNEATKLTKG